MNSATEKIPVKQFNNFFENDQTSKAFSRLAERKLPKAPKFTLQKQNYKYSKEELINIAKYPSSKITKLEFTSKLLEKNPELDEEIIRSFQKRDDVQALDSEAYQGVFNNNKHLQLNNNNQMDSSNSNSANHKRDPESSRSYRFSNKYYDPPDSKQSWRNDRHSPNFRGGKREYNNKRMMISHKYNSRFDNGSRDCYNEPEPEWFSDGPKSMTDFIDLKGFDDDCNNNEFGQLDETSSLETSTNKRESIDKDAFDFSYNLKDDFSPFFDSSDSGPSFDDFEEFKNQIKFGFSSRANKWFKSKKLDLTTNSEDESQLNSSKLSANASMNNTLLELFQKKNIDISQFSKKMELPQAVNVSELEASLLDNKAKDDKNDSSNNDDQNKAIMSKVLFNKFQLDDNKSPSSDKATVLNTVMNEQRRIISPNHLNSNEINHQSQQQQEDRNDPLQPLINLNFPPPTIVSNPMNLNSSIPGFPNHPAFHHHPGDQSTINAARQYKTFNPLFISPIHPMFFTNPGILNPTPAPSLRPENPAAASAMATGFSNAFTPAMVPAPTNFIIPNLPNQLAAAANLNSEYLNKQPTQLLQQQQQQQPQASDDSMANKLLKNSKFTPTSVYRKINKDQTSKPKQNENILILTNNNNSNANPINNKNSDSSVKSAELLLFQHLNLNPPTKANNSSTETLHSKLLMEQHNQNMMANNDNKNSSQETSSKTVNPNDIFSHFKNSNVSAIGGGGVSATGMSSDQQLPVGLPPLPLQNALTVEDLEKF